MSALERTFEWRRVIDPRTLVPSVIFSYAVTYDLRDLWLTQVIRDVIGDDPEVRGRKIVFHSKVLTKTDILVYYMSQSVQKQQRCGLKCRSRVHLTSKLATSVMSHTIPTRHACQSYFIVVNITIVIIDFIKMLLGSNHNWWLIKMQQYFFSNH